MRKNNISFKGFKTKKWMVFICCVLLLVGMSITAVAAPYSVKRARCPRCNQMNTSYGYDPDFRGSGGSAKAGQFCAGCNKIVPEGENHSYLFTSDKYFFQCNSKNGSRFSVPDRVYTDFYDNAPNEHYVNGKRTK